MAQIIVHYLIVNLLGNGLLGGIIYYEMEGMDPQKRTLFNRMISFVCALRIAHNLTSFNFVTAGFIFGPLGIFHDIKKILPL